MQRTIRILMQPTPEQAEALEETSRQFTAVFNAVCAYGWRERERNGVRLHHALYQMCIRDRVGEVAVGGRA